MNRKRTYPGIVWDLKDDRFTGTIEANAKVIFGPDDNFMKGRKVNPSLNHTAFRAIHSLLAIGDYSFTEENDVLVQWETRTQDGKR